MSETDSFVLQIHAVPNAKRTEVVGLLGDSLKIKIQAVPEGGRANRELEKFIAGTLNLNRRAVVVETGTAAREKRLRIFGIDKALALNILLASAK